MLRCLVTHNSLAFLQLQTPTGHPDNERIDEALSMLDGIIKHVDTRTGEAKCAFVKHKLRYTSDDQVSVHYCLSVLYLWRAGASLLPRNAHGMCGGSRCDVIVEREGSRAID